jgi:hypothetical protein
MVGCIVLRSIRAYWGISKGIERVFKSSRIKLNYAMRRFICKNSLVNLENVLIFLQLLFRMVSPRVLDECSNVPAHRIGLPEPCTQYTCKPCALTMALDHKAVFDQEAIAFAIVPIAAFREYFPSLARSDVSKGVAEWAHVVATSLIVLGQRQTWILLQVSSVNTE